MPTRFATDKLLNVVQWREIGPFRGGRSAAVTGVKNNRNLFYFGSVGGGVWRTQDGGTSWENISDGFFGGSVGAVAVAESDNNIMYVGLGEKTVRGNVSNGDGMWKSEDAGETWQYLGMKDSRHISRIRIHPKDPNIVYAAIMGDLFKSSKMRGVYKSTDGGKKWRRVLFANKDAGAVDLVMDPKNPKVLFASTWNIRRTPYSLSSGGPGSDIWKSVDGGEKWTKISSNKGLPSGTLGIIGVAVSHVNSKRVWAMVESKKGGLFRSDDGGETWSKVNSERKLRQRAWYYTRVYADTQDEDIVYVMNVGFHKSEDGGRTFKRYRTPHGDHHDLWIDPDDNQRMIVGDDGGAQVSYNGANNWSTYHNQPTAQFYRVTTDNAFPYRIYGAQQDNSSVRIQHRSDGWSITEDHWEATAGHECAHLAIDPLDNDIVYGGGYDGYFTRYNHRTKQSKAINVYPDNPMGHGVEEMKYRFNWNFPIFFSPNNPKALYTASNHLHRSYDGGETWEVISPDLTTNDPSKMGSSGGPITKDNTSVEYYCTIFAATESPYEDGLLWTGSDDGLVHVSRDNGKNWENVTPKNMPKFTMINSVEADPFNKGGLYVAGTRYKLGDYTPYLYKTEDYGKSWKRITKGIDNEHFTRVLRADPKRKGLLYAGTERGMYISFDDGTSWKPFQLNLPIVPITDLHVKENNLIAATQGRSFWIIDDLTVLHQIDKYTSKSKFKLFAPKESYLMSGGQGSKSLLQGQNHAPGVLFYYYFQTKPDTGDVVTLDIMEADDDIIKSYSSVSQKPDQKLDLDKFENMFNWNMRYKNAKDFKGIIMWWATLNGPKAIPGKYKARMSLNSDTLTTEFTIVKDPRTNATQAEFQEMFDFLIDIRDKLTETHQAISDIRAMTSQLTAYSKRLDKKNEAHKAILDDIKQIKSDASAIEKTLYQTQNRSGQDPLNFPIRLNNKLGHVASLANVGYGKPTQGMKEVHADITTRINAELTKWNVIKTDRLNALNQKIYDAKIDAIVLD
jgi:photosystem II stability/assembly factor-like uncharacterized protein/regulator of replication initiation timing